MTASQAVYGGSIPLTRSLNMKISKIKNKNFRFCFVVLYIVIYFTLFLEGCATSPKKEVISFPHPTPERIKKEGVYHKVEKGETLWRISRLYNIELGKIIEANNFKDYTKIYQGQMIFIPISPNTAIENKSLEKDFVWPIKGKIVSYFGTQRNDGTINRGIDIEPQDSFKVVAVKSGKIVFSSKKVKGMGKIIIIDHGEQLYTIYGNNTEVLVKLGQEVSQGEPIAIAEKGVLHFEIRKGHIPQNPLYFLP